MTKIIYIAGCGRSGSTLLERILNSHEKLFATGELSFFLDLIEFDHESGTHKSRVSDSEFWSEITREVLDESSDLDQLKENQLAFESVLGLKNCLLGSPSDRALVYKEFTRKLFDTIEQHLPQDNEYIIDSSKTARLAFMRPIALSKVAQCEVKVIHLVRDGRGCIGSYLKGSNRKMEQGLDPQIPFAALRCSLTWFFAQTAAHIFQLFSSSDSYLRVRYEDFVKNPEQTLNTIGTFLNLNFADQIDMLENEQNIPFADQIAGNRVRNQPKIILKKDVSWKQQLKWYHQLLFWVLDWPYALWYGYGFSKRNH